MADWTAIKTEYISDPKASYRSLAEKYGVSFTTLSRKAKEENWPELRIQHEDKVSTEAGKRIVSQKVKETVKQVSGIQQCADGLLNQITLYLSSGEILDADVIAKFTRSLKDLKEIKHDLTEYELREQDMRLRALEKQLSDEGKQDQDIRIEFVNREWNVE